MQPFRDWVESCNPRGWVESCNLPPAGKEVLILGGVKPNQAQLIYKLLRRQQTEKERLKQENEVKRRKRDYNDSAL